MPKMDLSKYGIKGVKEVLYNPSYEVPDWKVMTRVRLPNWVPST